MSQSRSVDSAAPGAVPAQHDAGPAAGRRNWRAACRLIILVAIPTLLGLALTGLRVTDVTRSAAAYSQVSRLAVLDQQVAGLTQAMEDERADTAVFIADGRPAAGLVALRRQYVITDGWAATVRRVIRQGDSGYPARTRASAATVLASVAELPGLRREAAQSQGSPLAVINGYSAATAGLFPISDGIADLSGNSALIASVRALGSLSRMKDQASEQQAILAAALAEGHFGPGALTALISAQAQQASDLASFRSSATREEGWALNETLASPLASQGRAVEQHAIAAGSSALALGAPAGQQWAAGMSFTTGWMRHSERQLSAWNTGYAQAMQQSAMRSAMITIGAALAVLALVLLATIIMIRSMARVNREAVLLAGEEARRRRSVTAVSAGFFRRSHSLLERLLRLIDSLELSENDPRRLASLFQIDHLVTRMRRHSDSALLLAGHGASSEWSEPVALVDVLRAAVSEIEQYHRVVLDIQLDDSVSGSAVADIVHLLAELLENATTFSPRTTQVIVSGHLAPGGGLLIDITDAGMGLPEDHLGQLNWQLAHLPSADVAATGQMGLFAVAHLAARHGITVTLGQPPDGGTNAEVYLPAALISADAAAGGWPGQGGEALRVRGRGGADPGTGDPLVATPRFAAGPEPAVAVPEPEAAEPGGVLPVVESVESQCRLTLASSLLRVSDPQAGRSAGAPAPWPSGTESAEIIRRRLASFEEGSGQARAEHDPKQRARDR